MGGEFSYTPPQLWLSVNLERRSIAAMNCYYFRGRRAQINATRSVYTGPLSLFVTVTATRHSRWNNIPPPPSSSSSSSCHFSHCRCGNLCGSAPSTWRMHYARLTSRKEALARGGSQGARRCGLTLRERKGGSIRAETRHCGARRVQSALVPRLRIVILPARVCSLSLCPIHPPPPPSDV